MTPCISNLACFLRVASLLLTVAASVSTAAAAATSSRGAVAFIGVNVVPMDVERVLSDQVVLVCAGKIAAIGKREDVQIPQDALRVEGKGRYLLPGLADMHAHLSGYTTKGSDRDVIAQAEMLLYVATGVTLVRNVVGSPAHLDYKRRVAAGELLGPRIFTATPLVDGPNPVWPHSIRLSNTAEAEKFIASVVADGYDQVKVYNELSLPVYEALIEAGNRHGIRVIGHVPFDVGIDAALAAHQYSIEHLRGYDYDGVRPEALVLNGGRNAERFGSWLHMSHARMQDLVRKTIAAGTWNTPTFVVDEMLHDAAGRKKLAQNELMRFVPPEVRATVVADGLDTMFPVEAREALRASFPQRYRFLKMLSESGAGLLIGTDSLVPYLVPGYTPIDEMKHFVKAGLTPFQALRAATIDPARFLGIAAEAGTVSVGKRADLLLVEGNPLENLDVLWRRSGVVLNGRWLPDQTIIRLLERTAATYPKPNTETIEASKDALQ